MKPLEKTEYISNWIKDYVERMPSRAQSLVIGISGGIDSSVSSTLSAMTGIKTITLSMPIKQKSSQHDLSLKHQKWLVKNFNNVETHTIELDELFKKFETLLYDYKKFYFNGFYPFIENADFNFPKYYINPKGTLSYQLQVEEMVNKKSVWEYGSKMVWNDEDNYYEGDYHPNLQGYKLIGEYIYKEIKDLI